jgi:U6 snRNA phosphodiesterase
MVLVDYSDSDEDDEKQKSQNIQDWPGTKRKADHLEGTDISAPKSKLPALPGSFHSLYATNARGATTDDPALHAGRTRQIPHVVGNWPTHIYLEWHLSSKELLLLENAIEDIKSALNDADQSQFHTFLRSELGAQLPLHISLSAPLVLKTENKEPFQEKLWATLCRADIKAFHVQALELNWVSNHDESRFFLVLKVSKPPHDELNRLLRVCNDVVRYFGLSQLYDRPSEAEHETCPDEIGESIDRSDAFHISIAWSLHRPMENAVPPHEASWRDKLCGLNVPFSVLKLKMGNIVVDLSLKNLKGLDKG